MKKIIVVCLSFVLCNISVFAQESSVQGFYLQGDVGFAGTDGTSTSLSGKYWGEYIGGQVGLGYGNLKADIEGTDIVDQSSFSIGAALLAGIPHNNLKPYLSIGIIHSSINDELSDDKITSTELVPSLGLDIAVTDHLLLGVTFASLNLLLSGEVDSSGTTADLGGSAISLLNGFHVGYKF